MSARACLGPIAGAVVILAPAAQAASQPAVEILIGDVGQRDADGAVLVDLRLLNGGGEAVTLPMPDQVQALLRTPEAERAVWLERAADVAANLIIPPGGFARARYRVRDSGGLPFDGSALSIPAWSAQQVALAPRPPLPATARMAQAEPAPAQAAETGTVPLAAPPPTDDSVGNAFLVNLSAYEPIYAVYGPGTNSEARIQISFKYQLFGTRRTNGMPISWRDRLYFAYSQRMFWDLGAQSSPFRNIDYQPELFYITPSATLSSGISLSAQAGVRHESNGRDGAASRSINSLYVAPMAAVPLGGGYRMSIAPRLSFLIGDKSDNPDIRRYRGITSVRMEVGADDGLRLSSSARFDFGSGLGSVGADLSYPLPGLLGGGPDFYLFGQSFIGYGENLLDYNHRVTRFRIGAALVR
jgi:outer membrane phospholipase A